MKVLIVDDERPARLEMKRLLKAHLNVEIAGESLGGLEERLAQGMFLRANRSQILNVTFIEKLENWFSGNLKARLRGGAEVEISRRQSQLFRARTSL
jgi:two-component system LytT family response regulator